MLNMEQSNLSGLYPQAGQTQSQYLGLLGQGASMFTGQTPTNNSPMGLAIGGVTPDQQNSIVQQSMRYLDPQFQNSGYLNSGAAASIQSRTAADLIGQMSQFNVTNAGNVMNGLLTGNANAQSGVNASAGLYANQLAGLRQNTGSGNYSGSTVSPNPFLQSLQTSAGSALGGSLANIATGGISSGFSGMGNLLSGLNNMSNPQGAPQGFGNTFSQKPLVGSQGNQGGFLANQ